MAAPGQQAARVGACKRSVLQSARTRRRRRARHARLQFVSVHSRPVWPRLDLAPLAAALNAMEEAAAAAAALGVQAEDAAALPRWAAPRFTDTGGSSLQLRPRTCAGAQGTPPAARPLADCARVTALPHRPELAKAAQLTLLCQRPARLQARCCA